MVPVFIGAGFLIYHHAHHSLIEGIVLVALTIPFEAARAVSLSILHSVDPELQDRADRSLLQVIYVTAWS